VHNAAAGYWSIATGAMTSSAVLCAFDASFGAGLLEAMTQVTVDGTRSLLIACDTTYPEPLRQTRPIPDEFGVGLVLAPQASATSMARIGVTFSEKPPTRVDNAALEQLRAAIPAARSLPLLRVLAQREAATVVLDYLDDTRLQVEVAPC
jgi:hypothetical protein